jgi:hypothetical protein
VELELNIVSYKVSPLSGRPGLQGGAESEVTLQQGYIRHQRTDANPVMFNSCLYCNTIPLSSLLLPISLFLPPGRDLVCSTDLLRTLDTWRISSDILLIVSDALKSLMP